MRLAIVNLNLDPAELAGCKAIESALRALQPLAQVAFLPYPAVLAGETPQGADGWVLGPQGTPFAAYPVQFLPDLAAWLQRQAVPVLAICGGMQAVALALGGALGTVDGGPQAVGPTYGDRPRIDGLVPITVDKATVPAWLAPHLALPALPQPCVQRHAEQIAQLPRPLVAIASSPLTPVEAWAHPQRPWLGCQFHPERGWGEGGAAGRLWLQAWMAVVARATSAPA